jgi:hypothetical protein
MVRSERDVRSGPIAQSAPRVLELLRQISGLTARVSERPRVPAKVESGIRRALA